MVAARILFIALLPFVTACTKKNPARCADGICIDPDRPFCDSDGFLSGEPGTCIEAECTANELVACNGDVEISCNDTGTNYEKTQCPLGCDPGAGGCRSCTANAQCSNEAPICDAGGSCRGCIADDECESRVCDVPTGTCVAETSIVYATPDEVVGTCSRAQPCMLSDAIIAVRNSSTTRVIRMLPGNYTKTVNINFSKPDPIKIVATGATITTLGDVHAIDVTNGARVAIRGISSTSERHISCGDPGAAISELVVEEATLNTVGGANAGTITRCTLKLDGVKISLSDAGAFGLLGDDPVLEMNRCHMFGNSGVHGLTMFGALRARIKVTNSLLVNVYPEEQFPATTSPPGNSFLIAYSTLVTSTPQKLCNDDGVPRVIRIENSIIASRTSTDAMETIDSTKCTFTNTIVYPYSTIPPINTIIGDPEFVNVGALDFHLKSSSPGVDGSDSTSSTIAPTIDLEGRARPIGPAADLGAYEHVP